jgi:hypothetical protein
VGGSLEKCVSRLAAALLLFWRRRRALENTIELIALFVESVTDDDDFAHKL